MAYIKEIIGDKERVINTRTGEILNINHEKNEEEIRQKLDRLEFLKQFVEEHEKIKYELKEIFKEKQYTKINEYQITGAWVEKKETIIPATKYWDMRIKKIYD